jgi:hypothetical protein
MSGIVRDHRILAGMERAGFIERNGRAGQTERHWTGRQVKVITVSAGPKLEKSYQPFTYKGKQYKISYFDGCFHPFVVELGKPIPPFV